MSKRDMILVERVTDGENCSPLCPGHEVDNGSDAWCKTFDCETTHVREPVWHDAPYRCPQCLATPSAVVLTVDMVDAVKMMLAHDTIDGISGDNMKRDIDALRAAFTQIEGVGI